MPLISQEKEPKRLSDLSPSLEQSIYREEIERRAGLGTIRSEGLGKSVLKETPQKETVSTWKQDIYKEEIERRRAAAPVVKKERGVIGELAAGFGRGALGVIAAPAEIADIAGEAIGWEALEKAGESGAKAIEKYIKESPKLKRTESISKNILKNPELWKDPRWYSSIVGEGLPTILSMFIPGMAAAKAAKVAKLGAKGVRAARIAGGLTAGVGLEAAGAASDVRQYEEQTGEAVPISTKLQSVLGTGIVAGSLEYVPIFAMFGKAGASKLVSRVLTGMATEGTTEGAQELVANAFAKAGYDADQNMVDGVVESIVGGVLLGGGMGAVSRATNFKERVDETNPEEVSEILEQTEIEAKIPEEQQAEFTRRREETALRTAEERQAAIEAAAPMTTASDETTTLAEEAVRPEPIVEEIVPEEVVPEEISLVPGEIPAPLRAMGMRPAPTKPAVEKAAVPFMITRETEAGLSKLGYTKEDIGRMAPEDALRIVEAKIAKEPIAKEVVKIEPSEILKPDIESKYGRFLEKVGKRLHSEAIGQDILDTLEEGNVLPESVSRTFWEDTFFKLPEDAQNNIKKYLTGLTGMKPGDVMATLKGEDIKAKDWMDIAGVVENDLSTIEYLEGNERGYIALMAYANEQIKTKPKEPTVEKVEKIIEPEVEIPVLTDTTQAIAFGKKATPEQITELKRLRKESEARYDVLIKEDKLDEAGREALKAQLYREAFEVKEKPKEPKVEKPEVVEKEPWEMSKEEWIENEMRAVSPQDIRFGETRRQLAEGALGIRKNQVKRAIEEGEAVPIEVLKEYPDLAPAKPPTTKPPKDLYEAMIREEDAKVTAEISDAVKAEREYARVNRLQVEFKKTAAKKGYSAQAQDIIFGDIDQLLFDIDKGRINKEAAVSMYEDAVAKKIAIPEKLDKFKQRLLKPAKPPTPKPPKPKPPEAVREEIEVEPIAEVAPKVEKKEEPGFAWIKGKQKPILSARGITKGKNKGKYEVTLTKGRDAEGNIIPGAKKIITEKHIITMPEEKVEIVPVEKAKVLKPVIPGVKPKVKKEKIEIIPTPEGKEITVDLTKKEEAAVTPKQQKAYLLAEIDKAVKEAPKVKPFESLVKEFKKEAKYASPQAYTELLKKQARVGAERVAEYGTVTIHVPDDGVFTILNTKQSLEEFKKKAKKFSAAEPKAKKVIIPGVVRKAPVVETIDELRLTPDGKEFFTDGSVLIKGKPPAGAKYGKREATQEYIKKILATETDPAELKYYAFTDPDFGEGVSKTPIPSKLATPDYSPMAVFQSKSGILYGYNQFRLNAITKRFPKAKYGIAEKEWQEGLLIAYENKKPVAALMPIRTKGENALMENMAVEKGFIKARPIEKPVEEAKSRIKVSTTEILKGERGSFSTKTKEGAATFEDFSVVGKDFIKRGADTFAKFTEQMKKTFGEVWESVKHLAKELYTRAKAILTEERGEITIREEQPIPLKEKPKVKKLTPAEKALGLKPKKPLPTFKETTEPIIEKDYIANRKIKKDVSALTVMGIKRVKSEVTEGLDKFFGAISTRLGNVSLKLKAKVRKLDFDTNTKYATDVKTVEPLLRKAKKMNRDDFADWDYARKNSDVTKIYELVNKYGMQKEYESYRKKLDSVRKEAMDVGLEIGEIQEYAPRILKDTKGFLTAIGKAPEWPLYSRKIQERAQELDIPVSKMPADMRADIISNIILGGYAGLSGVPATKERRLRKIPASLNQYYMDSDAALMQHLFSMRKLVEARKFFGKIPEKVAEIRKRLHNAQATGNTKLEKEYTAYLAKYALQRDYTENIGAYIDDLIVKKEITPEQERTVNEILTARFHEKGTRGLIQAYKNISYIDTMGSPISALTQIGDLAWSMYEGGVIKTLKHAYKAARGKSRITKEDVGVERIAQEFADSGALGDAVSKVFKIVGLEKIDAIGKEALLNTALDKYQKQAKADPSKLRKEIEPMFEDETNSVIDDLINNKISENVKLLVYSRLLDFQPVGLSEMPQKYLDAGNGRLFYMLKTFTLKVFDVFRNESYNKIKTGDRTEKIEGMKNLARLSMFFVLANAGADELKDLILGRETDIEDRIVDNMLRLFGVSKFVTWKARTEGVGSALARQILPPFKFVDSASKDIITLGDEKGLETVGSIPVIGKLAYWHIGRGTTKREELLSKRLRKKATKTLMEGIVGKEIERLHDLDLLPYPIMPAKSMTIAGKRFEFNEEQYNMLVTESGQASKKKLDSLVGTKYWGMLSDKEKASRIQKIIKDNRKKARNKIKKKLKVAIPGMVPWKKTKKKKRPAWQETTFGKKAGWQKPMEF